MRRILFMLLDGSIAAIILLPFFCLTGRTLFRTRKQAVSLFLLAVYLCCVYAVVGLPDICYVRFALNYNLVPFAYMFSDYMNSLLNVALFIPLGVLLPMLSSRYHNGIHTLLFGLLLSLLIELLQIFTFRATDINDLITNTFGTLLGWAAGTLFLRLAPGLYSGAGTKVIFKTCTLSFGIMFLAQPFLSRLILSFFL